MLLMMGFFSMSTDARGIVEFTVPLDQIFEAVFSGKSIHVHIITVDDHGVVAWIGATPC